MPGGDKEQLELVESDNSTLETRHLVNRVYGIVGADK